MTRLIATATISSKGQITIPRVFRRKYPGLVPGAKVRIEVDGNDIVVFIPLVKKEGGDNP